MASTKSLWDPYEVLNIGELTYGHTCIGYAPSQKRRCHNPIAAANRQTAEDMLDRMSKSKSLSTEVRPLLDSLASRLLCRRYHQNQAEEVSEIWYLRMVLFFPKLQAKFSKKSLLQIQDDLQQYELKMGIPRKARTVIRRESVVDRRDQAAPSSSSSYRREPPSTRPAKVQTSTAWCQTDTTIFGESFQREKLEWKLSDKISSPKSEPCQQTNACPSGSKDFNVHVKGPLEKEPTTPIGLCEVVAPKSSFGATKTSLLKHETLPTASNPSLQDQQACQDTSLTNSIIDDESSQKSNKALQLESSTSTSSTLSKLDCITGLRKDTIPAKGEDKNMLVSFPLNTTTGASDPESSQPMPCQNPPAEGTLKISREILPSYNECPREITETESSSTSLALVPIPRPALILHPSSFDNEHLVLPLLYAHRIGLQGHYPHAAASIWLQRCCVSAQRATNFSTQVRTLFEGDKRIRLAGTRLFQWMRSFWNMTKDRWSLFLGFIDGICR